MNPITGEKNIILGGKNYVLRFTWRALAEIETKYGDNPNLFSPETVAFVAAAGLKDNHPDMTAEHIMKLSPPVVPFAKDVQEALQWAYFGAEVVPVTPGDEVKKKSHEVGLFGLIRRLWRRG